jgi:AcrR family transcriptional regulator
MRDAADETSDVARMVEMLWAQPRARSRGPKPAQTLAAVVDAAIGLADRKGLAAVTMQRVAQALGLTKMALYRYVPGRPELIAAMVDRAMGPPPALDAASGWRKGLETWALAAFQLFVAHPWGLEATAGVRVMGPREAAWAEAGLALLADTPLNGADRLDVLAVVMGHMRSMAQQGAGQVDAAEQILTAGVRTDPARFPHLARAAADIARDGGSGLSFGLACIFDGIAVRLGPAA